MKVKLRNMPTLWQIIKIQEFSELDMKMSADILQDIKDSGDIELEMSAFTEEALNELLAKSQEGEVKRR